MMGKNDNGKQEPYNKVVIDMRVWNRCCFDVSLLSYLIDRILCALDKPFSC